MASPQTGKDLERKLSHPEALLYSEKAERRNVNSPLLLLFFKGSLWAYGTDISWAIYPSHLLDHGACGKVHVDHAIVRTPWTDLYCKIRTVMANTEDYPGARMSPLSLPVIRVPCQLIHLPLGLCLFEAGPCSTPGLSLILWGSLEVWALSSWARSPAKGNERWWLNHCFPSFRKTFFS